MTAITRRKFYTGVIAGLVTLVMLTGIAGAEDTSVGTVTVSVKSVNTPPPSRVLKRMEISVATIGEHVLLGRKVADIADNKNSYEKLVKEVFDRVLVGYSVQQVEVTSGATTHVAVLISPWGEVVREVRLEIDYGSVMPEATALIKRDIGNIEDNISNLLIGMPVDSVDWAGAVSKSVIREMLAEQLPEFRANLEIVAAPVTTIKLTLIPTGKIIQDAKATLRSRSIPNVLLLEARPSVEDAVGNLRGLPVAFVERHSSYFKDALLTSVAKRPFVKRFGLNLIAQLNAGPDTDFIVNVETTKYKITLEGFLDLGRTTDNTAARLHIGEYVGKRDEIFLETTFNPGTVSWKIAPGWGHRLGHKTEAGVKYEINGHQGIFWLNQELGGNWSLRLERAPATDNNELGIRYKLHDFLTAEYIFTKNDSWLRLVGNL